MAGVDAFLTRLAQVIREKRLLPRRAAILVAVSGGLDSMGLLHALVRLSPEFDWRLEVAHFNHQLRGPASSADERLVRQQCAVLKTPFHVERWASKDKVASIKAGGVEQAARLARRGFLGRTAARIGAANIVLAHHADDQVESFFVRLLRGAGGHGLGGMRRRAKHGPPLSAWLVRPLLNFTRSEIADWVKAEGVRFRHDASNQDPRFLRNRVRTELLPKLTRDFSPAIHRLVLRTMQGLADEADWMRAAAADYLRMPDTRRPPFGRCLPALQRHVLALQLERRNLKFDWELIETLREKPNTIVSAPGHHSVSRDANGRLSIAGVKRIATFSTSTRTISLDPLRGTFEFAGLAVRWALKACCAPVRRLPKRELFDADKCGPSIQVRHWQPGDRFQPIGMTRPVKLQNLFTNAKVPQIERRRRMLATTAGGEIFWVEGLRIGEGFKVTRATRRCLQWRWQHVKGDGQIPADRRVANS